MRPSLPVRGRVASLASLFVSGMSRVARQGDGSVIGGRVALTIEPKLLELLADGRKIALVTGTNGKTTTTRFIAAAVSSLGNVATNSFGANMPAGHVSALARQSDAEIAVLEVDEHYVPALIEQASPAVVALLNLSRDQMDRAREVSMVAALWRDALHASPHVHVVANADDPMVVWAAGAATAVTWVAAGQQWQDDSWCCPECGGNVVRSEGDWACSQCDLRRPVPEWWIEDSTIHNGETSVQVELALPGRVNLANAAVALAVAQQMGVGVERAAPTLKDVTSIAGRYATVSYNGSAVRLLLAKNPAGWLEALQMSRRDVPVLLSVNARIPDGADTSWLYDIDFTVLRGQPVFVTGDRRYDLAVRLEVDDVPFTLVSSFKEGTSQVDDPEMDVVANYTAFQDIRAEVGRVN